MRTWSLVLLLLILGLAPGVSRAQAVLRTDTPRAGTLRVTFEPVITTWEREFTDSGRRRIGASLPAPVFVRAERRVTPLIAEFGISNRIAVGLRLPIVRVRVQAQHDTSAAGRSLDSLLRDSTYDFAPIRNTPRNLRYFTGDVELQAKYRLFVAPTYATSVAFVLRLPTGHQDSPHDLFDIPTGDHQTDLEAQVAQELIVGNRLWLNVLVRAARQQPGTRDRRVGPQSTLLIPRGATARLDWRPGDYAAIDVAPLYRFSRYFGAGFTAGYWSRKRDHYSYRSAQDSSDVATRLGAPVPASVLDAGTSERWLRLGGAVTYVGPNWEGGFSIEQTVSGAGGRVPAATVFRIVLRTSRWPF
ncbi:MAG TPA: hypothetical protein VN908_11380 [Gemmatimonadales bacterium]|nr:hypothetical protein [Gemmatimonadales bacterium]